MKTYAVAFLLAGIVVPTLLHLAAPESMPWWPDTASMGIAFGATATVIVWKDGKDREARRRFWKALREMAARSRQRM